MLIIAASINKWASFRLSGLLCMDCYDNNDIKRVLVVSKISLSAFVLLTIMFCLYRTQ